MVAADYIDKHSNAKEGRGIGDARKNENKGAAPTTLAVANKGSPRTEAPSPKAKTKADSAKGSGSARGDNGKRASTPVVNKRGGKKGKNNFG